MAHLWMKNETNRWAMQALDADGYGLPGERPVCLPSLSEDAAGPCGIAVRRIDDPSGVQWVLLVRPGTHVSINGMPLRVGAAVLDNRDEVRTPDGRVIFFSTETLARVEPFPADGRRMFCPRCKQQINDGDSAVKCPGPDCGLWHHESADMPCWSYCAECSGCAQQTALDTGFRWTPEDL
jgi:hypothetical protein